MAGSHAEMYGLGAPCVLCCVLRVGWPHMWAREQRTEAGVTHAARRAWIRMEVWLLACHPETSLGLATPPPIAPEGRRPLGDPPSEAPGRGESALFCFAFFCCALAGETIHVGRTYFVVCAVSGRVPSSFPLPHPFPLSLSTTSCSFFLPHFV